MKIIAINSSRRKKNTYRLLLEICDILKKEKIDMEIINLHDYSIKSCIGCENCLIKGKCVLEDDTEELMKRLEKSDGIILSSPVYLKSVSGMMKIFFDRTCSWYHRPVLYGKPVMAVATTKGSGLSATLKYLEDVGIQWGMLPSGKIGRSIINIEMPVKESECEAFISALKKDRSNHRPSFTSIINFNTQKVLSQAGINLDRNYWSERNWDKSSYYYPCHIGFFKGIVGNGFYRFLNGVMNGKKK